jgi:hypothetical protein
MAWPSLAIQKCVVSGALEDATQETKVEIANHPSRSVRGAVATQLAHKAGHTNGISA